MNIDPIRDLLALLTETTLSGSVAIALVWTLRGTVRRRFGAGVAYALWGLAPVAMLAALIPAAARPDAMQAIAVTVLAVPAAASGDSDAVAFGAASAWWFAAWLAGALGMAARLIVQQRRFVSALGPLTPDSQGLLRADISAGLPAVVGAIRQRIVLPCDFEWRFDPEQRALVLSHERIHIARGDTRLNALVAGLRCLYWFNPLVHLAADRFRQDQELSCDARVVAAHPTARRRYGEAMLKTHLTAAALPLGCHWSGFGRTALFPLKERIAMLKIPSPSRSQRAAGFLVLGLLGPLIALSASALDVDSGAVPPTENVSYRRMAPAVYPAESLANRVGGDVLMKVLVAVDGSPKQIEVEKSSGSTQLDEAAVAAVRKWQFNPAREGGQAVEGVMRVPISFLIDDSETPPGPQAAQDDPATLDGIYIRPAK